MYIDDNYILLLNRLPHTYYPKLLSFTFENKLYKFWNGNVTITRYPQPAVSHTLTAYNCTMVNWISNWLTTDHINFNQLIAWAISIKVLDKNQIFNMNYLYVKW